MSRRNIVLMGFMGTGKTTVGRILADRLGMAFVDMDRLIESRERRAIADIFARDGEPAFRRMERALVQELAAQGGQVIATGGGVVLNPQNVADYGRTGLVVCLMAEPAIILSRVLDETHRPLLEGGDKAQRIVSLLETRRPLYEAIPNRVETSRLSAAEVADRIESLYGEGAP